MKKLSIIIVNWNTADLLYRCLFSIQKFYADYLSEQWEVIVVDNASTDTSVEIAKSFNFVHCIQNTENNGFGKANNQGLKIATGEYVLFLNSDTECIDRSLVSMFSLFTNSIAAIGCTLLNPDKTVQRSIRKDPTFFSQAIILLKIHNFFPFLLSSYLCNNFNYQKAARVDQIMGAFMLCRKDIIDKIGGFDEHYWLWMEEVDLCLQIRKMGFDIYYTPDSRIIHVKGPSFEKHPALKKQKIFIESLKYFFKKNTSFVQYIFLLPFMYISLFLAYIYDFLKVVGFQWKKNKNL